MYLTISFITCGVLFVFPIDCLSYGEEAIVNDSQGIVDGVGDNRDWVCVFYSTYYKSLQQYQVFLDLILLLLSSTYKSPPY